MKLKSNKALVVILVSVFLFTWFFVLNGLRAFFDLGIAFYIPIAFSVVFCGILIRVFITELDYTGELITQRKGRDSSTVRLRDIEKINIYSWVERSHERHLNYKEVHFLARNNRVALALSYYLYKPSEMEILLAKLKEEYPQIEHEYIERNPYAKHLG